MTKTILLVTTGGPMKEYVLKHIKNLGYKLVILEDKKNWAKTYADDWILSDINNFNTALEAVKRHQKNNHFDGVIAFDEFGVELAAFLSEKLKLPGISTTAAETCRNKNNFRNFCQNNGFHKTIFKKINTSSDINYLIEHTQNRRIVVKPTDGFLSENVEILTSAKQLKIEKHKGFLAEEFLEGDEVDIDVIIQNEKLKFISISDNKNTAPPYCLQQYGSIPSSLSDSRYKDLKTKTQQLIKSLGIKNGGLHIEAISNAKYTYFIEANLRMGGAEVWVFNLKAYNVDLISECLKVATNQKIEAINTTEPIKHLVAHSFLPTHSGTLTTLNFTKKEIFNLSNVESFFWNAEIDSVVLAPPDGFRALGYVVVSGENKKQADSNLNTILSSIQYTVTPN